VLCAEKKIDGELEVNLKAIGAELILGAMALPWVVFVTVSIFSLDQADAVQETKLDQIKTLLEEVRSDVKSIKEK
jgi:hypothetical protein